MKFFLQCPKNFPWEAVMAHFKIETLLALDFRTNVGLLFICNFTFKILPIPDSTKHYYNE